MEDILWKEIINQDINPKTPNECYSCHQTFTAKSSLTKHLKTVDCSTGIHKCDECSKSFYKIENLQSHKESKHGDRFSTHGCNICNKWFCSKNDRNRHIRFVHLKEKDFSCLFCEMKFVARGNLNHHIRIHIEESNHLAHYRCGYCDVVSIGRVERTKHLATMHQKLKCELCSKMVSSVQSLENHMSTHTGEKAHTCQTCQKKFNCAHKMKLHLRIHTGERPHTCSQCKQSFARPGCLRKHMQIYHVENAKILKCAFCEREYSRVNRSKFEEHLRGHTCEKPYNCEQCSKSYQGDQGLRHHMRAIHSTEKRFVCEVCGRRFANRTNLNMHKEGHIKIGTHKCTHCSKVFVRKAGLRVHLKIHQTDVNRRMPFECVFCERRFANNAALLYHLMGHTGEKPTQCDLCEKSFATVIQLRTHMISHTREKYYKCRICLKRYPYATSLLRHMISAHNVKTLK